MDFGQTKELTASETLNVDSTDYYGSLTAENGEAKIYNFGGGYCTFDGACKFHYFDRDHQGNVRAMVNQSGVIEQIMNYYPFGAPYSDNTTLNPDLQPYKYNGKEFEIMHGRNAYDYGARLYDPLLPTWDRMDPLCEKYYHISPYAYCANDPVNAVDLDGRIIVFAPGTSDEFKKAYQQVVQYLQDNGCDEYLKILNEVEEVYTIRETAATENSFSWSDRVIEWNPYWGLNTVFTILSPATRLNHELAHAAEYQLHPDEFKENIKILPESSPDFYYHTKEDKRVITGPEHQTAEALGETDEEGITRHDHNGIPIRTISPVSNETVEKPFEFIIEYKKDEPLKKRW